MVQKRRKADLPWYAAAAANMVSLLTRGRLFTAAFDSPIPCRYTAKGIAGGRNIRTSKGEEKADENVELTTKVAVHKTCFRHVLRSTQIPGSKTTNPNSEG